jgi:hypothetical protein
MWEDEVCTGVHGGAWGRFSKFHGDHADESPMHLTRIHGSAWLIISPPSRPPLARVPADGPTRSKVSAQMTTYVIDMDKS